VRCRGQRRPLGIVKSVFKMLAKFLADAAFLTMGEERRAELSASVLQAFLRASPGITFRTCGRRCLAGNHLRTWCPPNKPARLGSGSGESWFDPRRGNLKAGWEGRGRLMEVLKAKAGERGAPRLSFWRSETGPRHDEADPSLRARSARFAQDDTLERKPTLANRAPGRAAGSPRRARACRTPVP
jgi:hypothetical protein